MVLDAIIHRKQDAWWQHFRKAPCWVLAKVLYSLRQHTKKAKTPSRRDSSSITVVCISDTHNSQPALPPGDILIHAGDLTQGGTENELQNQLDWLNAQPHLHKLVIAGNHDVVLDREKSVEFGYSLHGAQSLRWGSVIYLQRAATTLDFPSGRTLKVFGHPLTRKHGNWAFQYDKGVDAFSDQIDNDIDILVTHSPPRFHLDLVGWGDEFLLRELWRVRPALHVFGHVHEGYGRDTMMYDRFEDLYERVCNGDAGLLALLQMALLLLRMFVIGVDGFANRTVLINASAVGGLLDRRVREAQVVRL